MKKIIYILLSIAILGSCAKAPAGEDGKDGIDGKDGRNGSTMMAGTGVPLPNIGREGDFYLNLSTIEIYGPKTANGWGTPFSLKGLKGEKGDDGDKGETGDTGPRGTDGTNGTDGSKVLSGNGDPSISIGKIGDFYLDLQNRKLYGPKTNSGWGNGYSLAIRRFKLDKTDISVTLTRRGQIQITSGNGDYQITQTQSSQEIVEVTLIYSNNLIELRGKKGGVTQFTITDTYTQKSIDVNVVVQQLANINNYDYELSSDGRTLIKWKSDVTGMHIDMQNHDELKHVQHIRSTAFKDAQMTGVTLPNGLKTIGFMAFYQCTSLVTCDIPSGVTSIEGYAFYSCYKLSSVVIPYGITTIEENTFQYCLGLKSVVIPNSVTTIKRHAFDTARLTSLTLPNTLTTIGRYAFKANNFTSLVIPNGVTTIEEGAFDTCHKLNSVTILSNSLTTIEEEVFKNCYLLTEVDISDAVTTIKRRAFKRTKLTSVTLGSGIQHIGAGAFHRESPFYSWYDDDSKIETLKIKAITPPTLEYIPSYYYGYNSYFFYHSPFRIDGFLSTALNDDELRDPNRHRREEIKRIYVPQQSVDAYKNHRDWKRYAHIIEGF